MSLVDAQKYVASANESNVVSFRFEPVDIVGEYSTTSGESPSEFLASFEQQYDTQPQISAFNRVVRSKATTTANNSTTNPSSDIPNEFFTRVVDPVAPEFKAPLADQRIDRSLVPSGDGESLKLRALSADPVDWRPNQAEFNLFELNGRALFNHSYWWIDGSSPQLTPDGFGLEFEVNLYNKQNSNDGGGSRPFCWGNYKQNAWAGNENESWNWGVSRPNFTSYDVRDLEAYADYNDLTDGCEKNSIAIGIRYPHNIQYVNSAYAVLVWTSAPRGTESFSYVEGTVQAVSDQQCKNFSWMALTDCMGAIDSDWPAGLDKSRTTLSAGRNWTVPSLCWFSDHKGILDPVREYQCAPSITSLNKMSSGTPLTGVTNPNASVTAALSDGQSLSTIADSSGRWSVKLPYAAGSYLVSVTQKTGNNSPSDATEMSLEIAARDRLPACEKIAPYGFSTAAIERFAGSDRYSTAALASERGFPGGSCVAVVAPGQDFADGLSAAPIAAGQNAPLLLAGLDSLPASTANELLRLSPTEVLIAGGTNSLDSGTESRIQQLLPAAKILRIGAADKYSSNKALIYSQYSNTAEKVLITTGEDYPDAVSGSGAASYLKAPLILVNGKQSSVDQSTSDLLARLKPSQILVIGGSQSISDSMVASLRTKANTVTRISGDNRYETSLKVNQTMYPATSRYGILAAGAAFADSITAGIMSARQGVPTYLVQQNCMTPNLISTLQSRGTGGLTVFGGTASVSEATAKRTSC